MKPIWRKPLFITGLLALWSVSILSGCGVQVDVGNLSFPSGAAMCLQRGIYTISIKATSGTALDKARLQLSVQSAGGTFVPVNQGFPYADQNNSVSWGLVEGPGTYVFKLTYQGQELTAAPVNLIAEEFGGCGFEGTPKEVNFRLQ